MEHGKFILIAALAFFCGSMPFGVWIGKIFKKIDIRDFGSGNPGFANAFRTLGPFWGVVILIFDIGKGFVPVYLSSLVNLLSWQITTIGFLSVIGHCFSPFLSFKGGKGIATTCGVILFISWKLALIGFIIWLLMVLITGYSALGSLLGVWLVLILSIVYKLNNCYILFIFIIAIFTTYFHRKNITRLLNGTENKFLSNKK